MLNNINTSSNVFFLYVNELFCTPSESPVLEYHFVMSFFYILTLTDFAKIKTLVFSLIFKGLYISIPTFAVSSQIALPMKLLVLPVCLLTPVFFILPSMSLPKPFIYM